MRSLSGKVKNRAHLRGLSVSVLGLSNKLRTLRKEGGFGNIGGGLACLQAERAPTGFAVGSDPETIKMLSSAARVPETQSGRGKSERALEQSSRHRPLRKNT